jgi:VanZ family protein
MSRSDSVWRQRSVYWLPVVAYAGMIYCLSDQPRPPEPTVWFIRFLGDKVVHGVEYGILGVLCLRAFTHAAGPWAARSALWLAVAASTGYGVTDEVHQSFVPLRQSDPWDVAADAIGSAIAASLWRWLAKN